MMRPLPNGVYSMFGDQLPVGGLAELMARYPQMHAYLDDAHGMSWCGTRGGGSLVDGPLRCFDAPLSDAWRPERTPPEAGVPASKEDVPAIRLCTATTGAPTRHVAQSRVSFDCDLEDCRPQVKRIPAETLVVIDPTSATKAPGTTNVVAGRGENVPRTGTDRRRATHAEVMTIV
jgi:hypothetical protein